MNEIINLLGGIDGFRKALLEELSKPIVIDIRKFVEGFNDKA